MIRIKKDKKGRIYKTLYTKEKINAVISLGEENTVYRGELKFNIRKGSSVYGNEFFVELLNVTEEKTYTSRSNYDTLEIYIPEDKAKKYLKICLNMLENDTTRQTSRHDK